MFTRFFSPDGAGPVGFYRAGRPVQVLKVVESEGGAPRDDLKCVGANGGCQWGLDDTDLSWRFRGTRLIPRLGVDGSARGLT